MAGVGATVGVGAVAGTGLAGRVGVTCAWTVVVASVTLARATSIGRIVMMSLWIVGEVEIGDRGANPRHKVTRLQGL